MPATSFDPISEQQNVTLVNAVTLRAAERLIESCEHCHPGNEVNLERLEDKLQRSLHDPRITGIGDLAKQGTIP